MTLTGRPGRRRAHSLLPRRKVVGGDGLRCPAPQRLAHRIVRAFRRSRTRAVVAAWAEGYAFLTGLDRDQPIGGLASET